MKIYKHLVIGGGEVGTALSEILQCNIHDPVKNKRQIGIFDVIHIAFPYSKQFIKSVKQYQKEFRPKMTIIHSTVPVGTSKKLNAVHSPIRGVHPNLKNGIQTFVKFFGGEEAQKASKIFSDLGIKVYTTINSDNTEAGKLWDTTQYGVNILLNKEIFSWCKKHGVDFDIVYTEFNKSYNEGYSSLKRKDVLRPFLKFMPGKIGGHCVVQNSNLFNSKSSKILRNS